LTDAHRGAGSILREHPTATFVVVGATHPHVKERHGEAYRLSLTTRARRLNVDDHVVFHDRFVSDAELADFLTSADVLSGCSTLSRTPTPLSPPPPSINGCYARMRTGWQSIPCATADDVLNKISRPDVPEQLSVNAFTDSGGNEHPPLVYGQFQASIPAVASSQDVFLANAFAGCPTSTTDPRPELARPRSARATPHG
jgi:hypothetical protein